MESSVAFFSEKYHVYVMLLIDLRRSLETLTADLTCADARSFKKVQSLRDFFSTFAVVFTLLQNCVKIGNVDSTVFRVNANKSTGLAGCVQR